MDQRPARVLIVDDDDVTLDNFARMLRLEGFEVHTALTADEGWRQIQAHAPDAILVDLRMPVLDGMGLLRRMRATRHRVPTAVVTADYFIDEATTQEIQELGAELRLKPLWLEDLTRLVKDLVRKSEHLDPDNALGHYPVRRPPD
jgi:two-component system response regulator PrrA